MSVLVPYQATAYCEKWASADVNDFALRFCVAVIWDHGVLGSP
jgi:hypothetical protein